MKLDGPATFLNTQVIPLNKITHPKLLYIVEGATIARVNVYAYRVTLSPWRVFELVTVLTRTSTQTYVGTDYPDEAIKVDNVIDVCEAFNSIADRLR